MNNEELIKLGSKTAKAGFKNEDYVVAEFNEWKTSDLSKLWLVKMGYKLTEIEYVKAEKIKGSFKADIQVEIRIEIKLKALQDIQNLQVKLVSNPRGFNQIDKRWISKYVGLWDIPANVEKVLKHFTGELPPYIKDPRDPRRMFMDEFSIDNQQLILNFINDNKTLIISDILKGRGKFSAEWMLVILKNPENDMLVDWALEPINYVLNYYGNGPVTITSRGSITIGNITIQRKGGDNGRPTANMLQFKINPVELINKNPEKLIIV